MHPMLLTNAVLPALLVFLAALGGFANAQTTVTVSAEASHPIPSLLWGLMYEDISHSGDGGLYAELLQNRAFQIVTPGTDNALYAWSPVGGTTLEVVADDVPVSNALPNSVRVTVPEDATGAVGLANSGYFGINVEQGTTYNASFYYRFPNGNFSGSIIASLQSASGNVLAFETVTVRGNATEWNQAQLSLTAESTSDSVDNLFTVTLNGAQASGVTAHFALFSLFPPTFNNRTNGMRQDIAQALVDLRPSVFRFPGGNNLEGQTIDRRWQWNATLGPLVDRPGRRGDWGYINTDGLGLLEYLYWCEDIEAEPIMGVWAGYTLGGQTVPEDELQPYIDQAAAQIRFVIGDAETTEEGAWRASLGRVKPFQLRYVEIGNEDFLAPGDTYLYRWPAFVNALSAEFPDLRFIATTREWNPVLEPVPTEYDVHVYQTPTWFYENAFYYDDFERNGTLYFEGEYAVTSTNPNDLFGSPANGRLVFPTMWGAASEAAFMTGLERNADIVFAAAYAPLLGEVASPGWTPNLISFDGSTIYRSISYYVQQLFSLNRGDEYLPSTLPTRGSPVQWSVVRTTSGDIIIKVVNAGAEEADLSFELPFSDLASSGSLQLLTAAQNATNSPQTPDAAVPQTSEVQVSSPLAYTAVPYSVGVITFQAS